MRYMLLSFFFLWLLYFFFFFFGAKLKRLFTVCYPFC